MWTVFVFSADADVTLLCELVLPFRVVAANSGEDVVETVSRLRPGVVLAEVVSAIDWRPIAQLRDSPLTRNVPVVVLTASTESDRTFRRAAHQLGCKGYLQKPCHPETLLEVIQDVLFASEPRLESARVQY